LTLSKALAKQYQEFKDNMTSTKASGKELTALPYSETLLEAAFDAFNRPA
jgi:hypothetical protein